VLSPSIEPTFWRPAKILFAALWVAVLCAFAAPGRAQPIGPPHPPAVARLPGVADVPWHQVTAQDDELVLFAAGAVEAPAPPGWWVWELPQGREVRLAFAPRPPASLEQPPEIGFWVGYHFATQRQTNQARALSQFLAGRMQVVAQEATPVGQSRSFRLGHWLAVEQDFSLPVALPATGQLPDRRDSDASDSRLWGRHIAVRTPWGLFEVQARAPLATAHEAAAELAAWLNRVKFGPPRETTFEAQSATEAAASVFGCWKAYRSRMRLFGDGRIEILSDAPALVLPQPDPRPIPPPRRELLVGRYHAEGDLLFVEWQDGSLLNLRWKRDGGELLLTDHDGRTSRLLRIYE